jgi:23S rRNA (cytosine1962-C5)-methyltransferase
VKKRRFSPKIKATQASSVQRTAQRSAGSAVPVTEEGLSRLRGGHPWLYEDQVLGHAFSGLHEPALVPLGEHWFFFSPKSKLRYRRLGPTQRYWPTGSTEIPRKPILSLEEFELQFGPSLRALFEGSLKLRLRHLPKESECFRWIFAENDFIPGLLVEAYGPKLIAQIQSAPVEKFWPILKRYMVEAYQSLSSWPAHKIEVIEQRHLPVRLLEGLEIVERDESEVVPEVLKWNGFLWKMSPGGSQKTGSYLDQAVNHRRVAEYAKRIGAKTAWDLCSFEGGFSLHLLKAGLHVLAVDQSEKALQTLKENVLLNQLPLENLETFHEDIFDFMKRAHTEGLKADLIVLDPPSFLKNPKDKDRALRAYKELNLRALHCLNPGGILVSCTCSHHIHPEDYRKMLKAAAHDARRSVRILEVMGPSEDHSPLLGFVESEYLQAWYLEASF